MITLAQIGQEVVYRCAKTGRNAMVKVLEINQSGGFVRVTMGDGGFRWFNIQDCSVLNLDMAFRRALVIQVLRPDDKW